MVAPSEHRLSGRARVAVELAGAVAAPQFNGTIELRDGGYENLLWGTRLRDLELSANATEAGRVILSGRAQSPDNGGALRLGGYLLWNAAPGATMEITIDSSDLTIAARDDLRLTVTSAIAIAGQPNDLDLRGSVEVRRLEINIPDRLPASVVVLEVREINGANAGATLPAKPTGDSALAGRLDLEIDFPARTFVRGHGLDSEWQGQLRVTGDIAAPAIAGTLSVVRGTFAFAGQTFDISNGTLTFPASVDAEPRLSVTIKLNRSDLAAEISLIGPLSAPALKLRASPPLPEDEILSRVIFGTSVAKLSPLQALQLAESIASVSGAGFGGGAGDLVGKLRRLAGVDVLSVENDETSGPRVAVGKYLRQDIYIGVKQGAEPGSSEVEAAVDLTDDLRLGSSAGQSGDSRVGLDWRINY